MTDPKWPLLVAAIYSLAIVFASLTGGWLPLLVRLTHTRMQLSMSVCGGFMLGIGLFHMLPHSFEVLGDIDRTVWWVMTGLLAMFFLIRAFQFHQHEPVEIPQVAANPANPVSAQHSHPAGDFHTAQADVHPAHVHAHQHHDRSAHLSWVGLAAGLGLHTLLDGMALAASVQAEAVHGERWLLGVGTFVAILLHKPLDSMPVAILMAAGGASIRLKHVVNGLFALLCPLGVALFFLGVERFSNHQAAIVGCALAFSAGVFICISLADLLPELEFHAHDRFKLSLALLLGVAAAWGIGYLEPEEAHPHPGASAHQQADER